MTNLDTMENLCPAAIPPSRRRYETAGMRAANRSFCMMSSMLRCWQKISARCCPTTDTSAFASGGTTNAKNKDKQSSADTHGASGTNCWRVFRRHRVAFPNEAFAATQLPWRHPPSFDTKGLFAGKQEDKAATAQLLRHAACDVRDSQKGSDLVKKMHHFLRAKESFQGGTAPIALSFDKYTHTDVLFEKMGTIYKMLLLIYTVAMATSNIFVNEENWHGECFFTLFHQPAM